MPPDEAATGPIANGSAPDDDGARPGTAGEELQRLRTLLDTATDGIHVIDADGNLVQFNQSFRRMLGYDETEARSLNVRDWDAQIPGPDLLPRLRAVIGGESSTFETRHRRKDGTVFQVEISARRIDFGGTAHLYASARDITTREAAEDELRASGARYRTLTESIQVGVLIYGPDAEIQLSNAKALELLGVTDEQLRGKSPYDADWTVVHEDGTPYPAPTRPVLQCIATRQPVHNAAMGVYRPATRDWVWLLVNVDPALDPQGNLREVVCTFLDITERKLAEATLRLKSAALDVADNAIVITTREGIIEWANAAFSRLTGYSAEEAVGRNPGHLLKSGKHDTAFFQDMWATILSGSVWRGELINRRKDGSLYTDDMTITPVKDALGAITHFIAVKQDITQRRILEEQFRQAQKMESVGRLAGGVAHDFNNMLGVILGHAELALMQMDESQPLHEDLSEIRHAAMRSADLTRQLLAFARKQDVMPSVLDLNTAVEQSLKMLQRLIGEDILLIVRPGDGLWPVRMDPSQVDQILANLCVNSRDAIKGVGTLVIETANYVVSAQMCAAHPDAVPGEYVRLTVTDDGCGMSSDVLAKIFEPFFTTKSVGEGTGLGLATVYGAVKQNNGFIVVSSAPGDGTMFEIHIPRHLGRQTTPAKDAAMLRRRGHETILVVEDESSVLRMIARTLEAHGYTVLAAHGPHEAIRLAADNRVAIDLLLTDVVMPSMNGRDLADTLVSAHPKLKHLFVSGFSAQMGEGHETLMDGAHFLPKPFTLEALTAKVREVLDRA